MIRAAVLATCAIALLAPSRPRAEVWSTVHSSEGGQSWTLSAEGEIEVTPDGSAILEMSSDASLRVASHGRSGDFEIVVGPDADGRPVILSGPAWRTPRHESLARALRLLVVAYWASEPSENARILQAAGGAVDLTFRDRSFRESWCRYHALPRCDIARARVSDDWRTQGGSSVRDEDGGPDLLLSNDSLAMSRVDWLENEATAAALERVDSAAWLARQAVLLGWWRTPADHPHADLAARGLALFRRVLIAAPDEPMLTLALTWLVVDGPISDRVPSPWEVGYFLGDPAGFHGSELGPHGRVRVEAWTDFLFAVPRYRRMEPEAWKDWVDGLRTMTLDAETHSDLLQRALAVAPPEDWAMAELAGEARFLTPLDRWSLLQELSFREAAGEQALRTALTLLGSIESPPTLLSHRKQAFGRLGLPSDEDVQGLRARLEAGLEALAAAAESSGPESRAAPAAKKSAVE